jgi:hypothetical protein
MAQFDVFKRVVLINNIKIIARKSTGETEQV